MSHSLSFANIEFLVERYRTLLEVSESIARHLDLATLLRDLAHRLPRVVPVNFIGVSLHDAQRKVMRLHALQANIPADLIGGHEEAIDETPAGLVWQTQQSLLVPNLAHERRWPKVMGLMQEDGTQALCVVPLTTAVRRLGAIGFGSIQQEAYRESDVEFLLQVGKQIAVAVDNVLHYQDLTHDRDRLKLLLDVNNSVVSTLELRELFTVIGAALRGAMPHERTSLVLYEPERNQFRLYASHFPDGNGLIPDGLLTPVEGTPAGAAFTSRKPIVFDEKDLTRFPADIARLLLAEGVKFLCCVPLLSHNRALGTLNVATVHSRAFTPDEIELLSQVASQFAIAVENALAYQQIKELKNKLAEEKLYLEEEIRTEHRFEEIIGDSLALRTVLKQVETVAPTDSTVLILGETGTGKELIARAIHRLSGRHQRTFVKLNCAAIPTGLLESELFGHERGAFTGAIAQKIGRFELADGGTLFLDEVGDIPVELQSKLLRVLQEREFERLGATRTIRVNVRLVAATNQDLIRMVGENRFRSDLYYRLNVFPMTMPSLRERATDIPLLVRYFVQQYAARMNKTITTIPTNAMDALSRYHWPGNVRELENFIERSVILSQGTTLHVPFAELKVLPLRAAQYIPTLHDAERDHILRALRESNWIIGGESGAAARLGMKRTTLNSKMHKLGIVRDADR
ncbi:MAG: sigma 54-interacting transcriptional regulator [Nitrospirales bacterium]|nr:sigma 54-interacting transcriptional regulator [Nitrospirales bacterium]